MTVMVTAADQHEEANAQRDEAENPDFNGANSVPDVDEFDLSEFAVELEAVAGGGASDSEAEDPDDDDGATAHGAAPPGAPPAYRAAEANAMAEEKSESEKEEAPRRPRSRLFRLFRFRELAGRGFSTSEPHHYRYIDDEADDTPEF